MARRKIILSKEKCILLTIIVVTFGLVLLVINRTVVEEPECNIHFHDKSAEIYIGDQKRFGYTIENSDGNESLSWTTSNANIATVNASGLIEGKSFGDVTITVSMSNGKSSSMQLRVKSYPVQFNVITDIKPNRMEWYNSQVNITLTTLNISNIKYCATKNENCNPTTPYKDKITLKNGIWYLHITGLDRNGKEFNHREIFKIDLVAPVCNMTRIGKLFEETATIDVICEEDASGIEEYEWYRDGIRVFMTDESQTYAKEIYAEGKHKYRVRVYDVAGNMAEYKIDN